MPTINDKLVLDAVNKALADLKPRGSIPSLTSTEKSHPEWSCNNFSPATLEYVLEASKGTDKTTNYKGDPAKWPDSFPTQSFVNFSLMFKDSSSNHNFNVFFDNGNISYLTQVYLGHTIRISTPDHASEFIKHWKQLGTKDWVTAYEALFYVKPPTHDNAYTEQYVTVVTSP